MSLHCCSNTARNNNGSIENRRSVPFYVDFSDFP